jgi:hypothetical protein
MANELAIVCSHLLGVVTGQDRSLHHKAVMKGIQPSDAGGAAAHELHPPGHLRVRRDDHLPPASSMHPS